MLSLPWEVWSHCSTTHKAQAKSSSSIHSQLRCPPGGLSTSVFFKPDLGLILISFFHNRAFSGGEVITEVMKGLDQHRIYPNSDGAKHCTVTYLMPGTNWRWLTQTSDCSEFLEQPSPYAFIHPRVNCKDDRVWDGHFGPKVRRMRFCINLLKNEQQTQAGAAAQG